MSKDYFTVKTKHDPQRVVQVVGSKSNAKLAQQIKTEDPMLYQELVADGVALGLIDPPRRQQIREMYTPKQPRQFTETELAAMHKFSLADCRRYYVNPSTGVKADAISELSDEDQATLRIAAVCHGIKLPERVQRPPEPKAPQPPPTGKVTQKLRDYYHLPENFETTDAVILTMISVMLEAEAKEAEAKSAEALKASMLKRDADGKFVRVLTPDPDGDATK